MDKGMGATWFVYSENERPVEVYADKSEGLARLTMGCKLTPSESKSIQKFQATETEPGARLLIVGWLVDGRPCPDRSLTHCFGPGRLATGGDDEHVGGGQDSGSAG